MWRVNRREILLSILAINGTLLVGCGEQEPTPHIALVEGPTFAARALVGAPNVLRVVLRNSGEHTPSEIKFQFSSNLFDGYVLDRITPSVTNDSVSSGRRYLRFAGIAPGEQREYTFSMRAKTAGEYPFYLSLYAGAAQQQVIAQYTIKNVIVP